MVSPSGLALGNWESIFGRPWDKETVRSFAADTTMTNKRVVLSTTGSHEEARKIAQTLVDKQLAACVNIVPGVESVYRWQGKTSSATEWLLVMKTTESAFPALREALKSLHSYQVPECLAVAVDDGYAAYLDWMGEAVKA